MFSHKDYKMYNSTMINRTNATTTPYTTTTIATTSYTTTGTITTTATTAATTTTTSTTTTTTNIPTYTATACTLYYVYCYSTTATIDTATITIITTDYWLQYHVDINQIFMNRISIIIIIIIPAFSLEKKKVYFNILVPKSFVVSSSVHPSHPSYLFQLYLLLNRCM